MSVNYNPRIVTDGLILSIDGANPTRPKIGNTTITANGGASGPSNGYYTYDGTDDYHTISNSVYNVPYTGKTIMVAARKRTFGTNRYRAFLGNSDGSGFRTVNFYLYESGGAATYRLHFSAGGFSSTSNSFSMNDNQWFIASVSQDSTTATHYLNNNSIGSFSQTLTQFQTGGTGFLGRADNFWLGDIAFWMVYNKALTEAEIQQNFNALRGRYGI
jgi:hypothetical protein